MPEKISIVKESGETVSSNIVSVFTIPDTEKKYIITTENAVDPHGLTVLHVSEIVDGELKKVATDEEWSSIKTIMRAIISGNVGSYKYLPAIEVIKAEGQYSRDISVSASASKQMIDNYNAADTSAAEESTDTASEEKETLSDDNEVMPGIAEVGDGSEIPPAGATPNDKDATPVENISANAAPAEPIVDINSAPPVSAPPVPATPTPTPEVQVTPPPAVPAVPEVAPPSAVPIAPVAPPPAVAPQVDVMDATAQIPTVVPGQVVQPTAVPVQPPVGLSNEVQVPSVATPVVQQMNMSPTVMEAPPMQPMPTNIETAAPMDSVQMVSVAPEFTPVPQQELATTATIAQPMASPMMPDPTQFVQVAQPTQVVPTAQIVQGVPEPTVVNTIDFNPNVAPSFKPDATLDEVVKGAQDMFMEGVRSLVQTIQEKVYRDLYIKEAEMKKREALVAQKEQMLNTQFATMMSNITANFNGVGADSSQMIDPMNPQG